MGILWRTRNKSRSAYMMLFGNGLPKLMLMIFGVLGLACSTCIKALPSSEPLHMPLELQAVYA